MKNTLSPYISVILFATIFILVLCTGCGERLAVTDIWVGKFDSDGNDVWNTKIDSGRQDYATSVIETTDGGYALAGWIADNPRATTYPRIIRLDGNGDVMWDRTLDSGSDRATAIVQAQDGIFIVALSYGKIYKIGDNALYIELNRTSMSDINAMIPAGDGGYAIAGGHTARLNANGTLVWDQPYTSTSIIQSSDGGFIAERSGAGSTFGRLFHFDADGGLVWTQTIGSREMGKITSLYENPDGTIEAVYTYPDPRKDKDLVQYMESEKINLGNDGTVTGTMPLVAVDPLVRASDGGYVFLAYSFPGLPAYTSFPHANSALHIVRLTPDGKIAWNKSLDLGRWIAPYSVIQTRDGGFVTLMVLGS